MSITDELRAWFKDRMFMANGWQEIHDIADRIDAEHERAMYNMRREFEEWKHTQDTCYVKLPKDADGVPIHIGDKVDSDHYEDGTVIGVHYFRAPNGVVFEEIAVQPNGWDVATWRDPEEYAHHHEPTVEDVLREFAEKIIDSQIPNVHPTYEEAIAEYAAKLRLAEEGA